MNIYLISGLGANYRAFQYLSFAPEHQVVHIPWIDPLPKESLEQYAERLSAAIDTSQPFVIVGLSFGGMIAIEMRKKVKPHKTILLSSISCYNELPWLYKISGRLGLHKLIPARTGNRGNPVLYWILGIDNTLLKQLFLQIMGESNPAFTRWAIQAILTWKQRFAAEDVVRIHGDKDRLLPITRFAPHYVISKGGHLMVANKADEISMILAKELT